MFRPEIKMPKLLTIDKAIKILAKAKSEIGGDKVLILSLTNSQIEDVNINDMKIINENGGKYIEVQAKHTGVNKILDKISKEVI